MKEKEIKRDKELAQLFQDVFLSNDKLKVSFKRETKEEFLKSYGFDDPDLEDKIINLIKNEKSKF